MLIVFEGVDGAGKTTHILLLQQWLVENGYVVSLARDPGSTVTGEVIRQLLFGSASPSSQRCEALLFLAARAELVETIIRPSLEQNFVVLSDRFELSSLTNQGYACGLPIGELRELNKFASNGVVPDLTIILDIDPEIALARKNPNSLDVFELRGTDYRTKVRQGLLEEASRNEEKIVVVNAEAEIEEVQNIIKDEVLKRLQLGGRDARAAEGPTDGI